MTDDTVTTFRLAYSIDQLSDMTSIGRTKIYDEIKERRLVARKSDGRTIVLHEEAMAWLRAMPTVVTWEEGVPS